MDLILVHPEIPHNTGCAARLAAATGLPLHLIEPLGFSLEDRYLKRAGLDYWPQVQLHVHRDWPALVRHVESDRAGEPGSARPLAERVRLFSARGGTSLFDVAFEPDDLLIFGCESQGLPASLLDAHPEQRVYVPVRPGVRSLNLANTVCLASYVALHRSGSALPDNDGHYDPHPLAEQDLRASDVAEFERPSRG